MRELLNSAALFVTLAAAVCFVDGRKGSSAEETVTSDDQINCGACKGEPREKY
jgi:hypothetical protein